MIHELYINRCLQLAKLGFGTTAPNPMVGAVLVYENNIIGEGFTSPFGGNHAEVNCIKSVSKKNEKHISDAILYVSLEPCAHYGKTPPCSNLIVKKGIKKVVIGILDTNSLVSGKGVRYLKNNGCEVITNILEVACYDLNKRFFTFHNKKRPYIILKWAVSKDGFIGKLENKKEPILISNNYSRQLVHLWRSQEQAILIGTNTALNDNPSLNVRYVKGKNPIRIVIDKDLKITKNYKILNNKIETFIITKSTNTIDSENVHYKKINFPTNTLSEMCKVLYDNEIQSLIVEGGNHTLQSFIDANLWDEARIFKGNNLLNSGVEAPKLKGNLVLNKRVFDDELIIKTRIK